MTILLKKTVCGGRTDLELIRTDGYSEDLASLSVHVSLGLGFVSHHAPLDRAALVELRDAIDMLLVDTPKEAQR